MSKLIREESNGDWIVKCYAPVNRGDFPRKDYYFRKKKATRLILESRNAKKCAAYTLINKDLRNAKSWLEEIEKNKNQLGTETLIKALFHAIIISYGKCFVAADKRGVKLEKTHIPEKFHPIHETLMSLRHQFVAHAGYSEVEECIIVMVCPKGAEKIYSHIFSELNHLYYDLEEMGGVSLLDHLISISAQKRDDYERRLHKEMDQKLVEDWPS